MRCFSSMPIRSFPRPLHVRLASTQRRGQNLSERYRKLENTARVKPQHDDTLHQSNGAPARTKMPNTVDGFVIPTPPLAPADDQCCMSGCAVCVYDLYEDALATYKEEVAALCAALAAQDIPEAEWPVHVRTETCEGNRGNATAPKARSAVLDAFEEMERALQVKRDKRAAVEAEKRRRDGIRLDLREVYEGIKWVIFPNR